jgi:hypothetical protein
MGLAWEDTLINATEYRAMAAEHYIPWAAPVSLFRNAVPFIARRYAHVRTV